MIYAFGQCPAQVWDKSGVRLLVVTCKTECKFESVIRDLFFDLFMVMHEKVCSQIYVDAKNTHILLANFSNDQTSLC